MGGNGPDGRIDVFDPQGRFIVEIPDGFQPCSLAVDSEGNLYVGENGNHSTFPNSIRDVVRYKPDSYPPTAITNYAAARIFEFATENVVGGLCAPEIHAIAVDPSNDHLYVQHPCRIEEYGSAADDSSLIAKEAVIPPEGYSFREGLDVYGKNHDVYAFIGLNEDNSLKKVLVFDGADKHLRCEVLGPEAPGGGVAPFEGFISGPIAVDQSNGDFYFYDYPRGEIDQFAGPDGACDFIDRLPSGPPTLSAFGLAEDVAVDAPMKVGEPGYDSPNEGYVYVTSGKSAKTYHLYAFKPRFVGAPEIEGQRVSGIGEAEALLQADVNPDGLPTVYHFEYTTVAAFAEHGFEGAMQVPVPDASLAGGGAFVSVSQPISGLSPGVAYRFRLVASNCEAEEAVEGECLTEGEGGTFSTYPTPPTGPPCPNAALRSGRSVGLPDCRAFELVTPPDTNGRIPTMSILGEGFGQIDFPTMLASPDGNSLVFGSNSGALPGIGGGGYQDTFEARRGASGWGSVFTGIEAAQAQKAHPGGISPNHHYAFWNAEGSKGSLLEQPGLTGGNYNYLRVPPGIESSPNCAPETEAAADVEWVGCGSLGSEPRARGRWIGSEGRIVFVNSNNLSQARQLEPCGPPTGTIAIYERTPGGPTRCVSLLPGDITPSLAAGYHTTSADGSAIAFTISSTLYARLDSTETVEVAEGSPTFGGISSDGGRVFYLLGGNVFACNVREGPCAGPGATHEPIAIGSGGKSTLVNVSADGSHAYFISTEVLAEEENGRGAKAQGGEENLYEWDEGEVQFIAVLDHTDVVGEEDFGGLGLWVTDAFQDARGPANDPSRTNSAGTVLTFESSAGLTDYESEGHREVYRYDSRAEGPARLLCVSCNPTGQTADSDAGLQSRPTLSAISKALPPTTAQALIANLSEDGEEVFFQSDERLVSGDFNGRQDVYEWQAQGKGGCGRAEGCLYSLSGGRSRRRLPLRD